MIAEIHPAFDYAAIIMFLIGHLLIILRNGQGIRAYFRAKLRLRDWIGDIGLGIGIILLTTLLFTFTLLPHVQGTPLLYILIIYALVLDLSLWTGWTSLRVGHFPSRNALLSSDLRHG